MPSSVEQWRNARYLDDRTTDSGQQPEEVNEAARDQRTEGQRDKDRILYCSALRRLASVTQVTSPTASGSTHNRLTHALKVAQVGRRISENLLRSHPDLDPSQAADPSLAIDPDVVEAAGLAHDLGHPPFGHVSEEQLNKLAKQQGCEEGFEGNAQSFRIVAALEIRGVSLSPGLGLTRATLNALLKYPSPWNPQGAEKQKFGFFKEEKPVFDWCRSGLQHPEKKTLEAQIMDWADDITYAAHDLEDFYRTNFIPVSKLKRSRTERSKVIDEMIEDGKITTDQRVKYRKVLKGIASAMPRGPYVASRIQRQNIRSFVSYLVGKWINSTKFENRSLKFDSEAQAEVAVVKAITWKYVIRGPTLQALQKYQVRLVEEVFHLLTRVGHGHGKDKRQSNASVQIPPNFMDLLKAAPDKAGRTRVVIDVLATMGEEQVANIHRASSEVAWTLA
ncbi:MAG: dNTP triphosphohydrolase [Verrucomicrobia bacterium]|nr:dNTP triphosphohydrolase [Verrucomicrobiota bacterium]